MSDDLTKAIAEALGCEVVRAEIGRPFWCEQHAAWSDDGTCPEATRIAAALAPLIEARAREARAEALSRVADKWQWGDWANAPRGGDIAHERIAAAQYVTAWLRERAEEVRRG